MTCYERLRNNNKKEAEDYKKLQSYFRAPEKDKLEQYHKKRGRE